MLQECYRTLNKEEDERCVEEKTMAPADAPQIIQKPVEGGERLRKHGKHTFPGLQGAEAL